MLGRWLVGGSTVIAAAVLVACASSAGTRSGPASQPTGGTPLSARNRTSDDAPSRAAPSPNATAHGIAAECGRVPTSSGPLARLAHLTIKAPATVPAGRLAPVTVTVTSTSTGPRVITTPGASALLLVRGGRVVGRTPGPASAPQVPLPLRAGATLPAQAIPGSVRLTSCGPEAKTSVLATGDYTVVAVLSYELDSLYAAPEADTGDLPTGQRSFVLVSRPAPIVVG